MEQICNLETVKPQEAPIKVCVTFYNIEICYRGYGIKKKIPVIFNREEPTRGVL